MARPQHKQTHSADSEHFNSAELWSSFEVARGNLDMDVFERLLLGLLFCRALSQFDPTRPEGSAETAVLRDPNRWPHMVRVAQNPRGHAQIKDALAEIVEDLPINMFRGFQDAELDGRAMRELVLAVDALAPAEDLGPLSSCEMLSEIFSFCVRKFALLKGKSSGELPTPESISKLLVALAAPKTGVIFDPCAGSGGLLIEAWNFALRQNEGVSKVKLAGQESNAMAWRTAKMNFIMRGIPCSLGLRNDDVFCFDQHADLKATCILADPPFNAESRFMEPREWEFGAPPQGNANFAWIQHIIKHLAADGVACLTMGNSSLTSQTCGEAEIRRKIVEADLLDCIVGLPAQLFPATRVSACVWILTRSKTIETQRQRRGQTLFIDAQNMGRMVTRAQRVLDTPELDLINGTYRAWSGQSGVAYENVPGLCRSVGLREMAGNQFQLTPGRYVGMKAQPRADVNALAVEKLTRKLSDQFAESIMLDQAIKEHLERFSSV